MKKLRDVIAFILENYPHKKELSNARLTKLVYLSDWHFCLKKDEQITPIKWYFDNYGPFVWDVKQEVEKYPDLFTIEQTTNAHGSSKNLIKILKFPRDISLTDDEKESLEKIMEITKNMYWDDFIKLVYSTYPILSTERYSYLHLESLAKRYKESKKIERE